MAETRPLGPLMHSFFVDHLVTVKGLRPAIGAQLPRHHPAVALLPGRPEGHQDHPARPRGPDLRAVLGFLRHLENDRGNHIRTRNQRLAVLHTLFDYIATREPEMLGVCQQVAAIPMKRSAPAETHFLERDEIEACYGASPARAASPCATEPCCCSSTTPAHGSKRSPICESGTSTSASTRSSACTARETSGGPARCGAKPPNCSTS